MTVRMSVTAGPGNQRKCGKPDAGEASARKSQRSAASWGPPHRKGRGRDWPRPAGGGEGWAGAASREASWRATCPRVAFATLPCQGDVLPYRAVVESCRTRSRISVSANSGQSLGAGSLPRERHVSRGLRQCPAAAFCSLSCKVTPSACPGAIQILRCQGAGDKERAVRVPALTVARGPRSPLR